MFGSDYDNMFRRFPLHDLDPSEKDRHIPDLYDVAHVAESGGAVRV